MSVDLLVKPIVSKWSQIKNGPLEFNSRRKSTSIMIANPDTIVHFRNLESLGVNEKSITSFIKLHDWMTTLGDFEAIVANYYHDSDETAKIIFEEYIKSLSNSHDFPTDINRQWNRQATRWSSRKRIAKST